MGIYHYVLLCSLSKVLNKACFDFSLSVSLSLSLSLSLCLSLSTYTHTIIYKQKQIFFLLGRLFSSRSFLHSLWWKSWNADISRTFEWVSVLQSKRTTFLSNRWQTARGLRAYLVNTSLSASLICGPSIDILHLRLSTQPTQHIKMLNRQF